MNSFFSAIVEIVDNLFFSVVYFVFDWIAHHLETTKGYFNEIWLWVKDMVVIGWQEVSGWLWSLVPDAALNGINGIQWSLILNYLSDVAWIFPVNQCLALVGATLVASGVIRIIRWALGLIPTLNLG